jgi:hypothetical protein
MKQAWRKQLKAYSDRSPSAKLLQKTEFPRMLKEWSTVHVSVELKDCFKKGWQVFWAGEVAFFFGGGGLEGTDELKIKTWITCKGTAELSQTGGELAKRFCEVWLVSRLL